MMLSLDFLVSLPHKIHVPRIHGLILRKLILSFLVTNNEKLWAQKLLRLALVLPEKLSLTPLEKEFPDTIPRNWKKKHRSIYTDSPHYVGEEESISLFPMNFEPQSLYRFSLMILDDYFSRDILKYFKNPEGPIFFGHHRISLVRIDLSMYFPEYFYFNGSVDEKYLHFEFFYPTRFKTIKKERYAEIFPSRKQIIRSLVTTWNDCFPDDKIDLEIMIDFAENFQTSLPHTTGPFFAPSYKRKTFVGFMGFSSIGFKDRFHPLVNLYMTLLNFGQLVGLGIERLSGYGRFRLRETSEPV